MGMWQVDIYKKCVNVMAEICLLTPLFAGFIVEVMINRYPLGTLLANFSVVKRSDGQGPKAGIHLKVTRTSHVCW